MDRVPVWTVKFSDRKHLMLQWRDPATGRRRSRTSGTAERKVAEQRAADLSYELSRGLHQDPSKVTWEAFRDLLEDEYLPHRRPGTRKGYRCTLDAFERACNPSKLASVTERTLSQFAARHREAAAVGTVFVRLAHLRAALRWAVKQKLLASLPAFPVVRVPRKSPQAVPGEAFDRLLAQAPDASWRAFLLAGWLAGLRLEEAHSLRWSEGAQICAPYLAGQRIIFPAEATKADADQWVPVDPLLAEALAEMAHISTQGRVFHLRGRRGEMTAGGVGQAIARMAKAAGVRLTYRSLRRGFGCRYAARVPAQVLQKLMRHSSISTTMRYYANIDDAVMEAVIPKGAGAGACQ